MTLHPVAFVKISFLPLKIEKGIFFKKKGIIFNWIIFFFFNEGVETKRCL